MFLVVVQGGGVGRDGRRNAGEKRNVVFLCLLSPPFWLGTVSDEEPRSRHSINNGQVSRFCRCWGETRAQCLLGQVVGSPAALDRGNARRQVEQRALGVKAAQRWCG